MGDDYKAGFGALAHGIEQVAEAFDIGVVERGVDFIEHADRGRVGEEHGKDQAHRRERLLAAREQPVQLEVPARGIGPDHHAWQAGELPAELLREDLEALELGAANLRAQIDNLRLHGLLVIVAVNRFPGDSERELARLERLAVESGAVECALSELYTRGGAGGEALALAVARVADRDLARLRHPYDLDQSIEDKIHALATRVYGAGGVELAPRARGEIRRYQELGYGRLPICMAKTQFSLSHDPKLKGAPRGYTLPIREVRLQAGGGFLVPLAGDIMTMPGLGRNPSYRGIDLDESGRVTGLF